MVTYVTPDLVVVAAFDYSTLVPPLAMAGALLVGAAIVAYVRRWQKSEQPLSPTASDQLAEFRSLYEKGIISEEEFKRLRNVLGEEIRQVNQLPEQLSQQQSTPEKPSLPPSDPPPAGKPEEPDTGIRPA